MVKMKGTDHRKKVVEVMKRLVSYLGLALLIWLFGLLILIPLSSYMNYVQSFVGFIILIPVSLLFFRVLIDMKTFSQIAGEGLFIKKGKKLEKKLYVHVWYAFWIVLCIIFFAPLIYVINGIIGGVFLFVGILMLMVLIFFNYKDLLSIFLRLLFPPY